MPIEFVFGIVCCCYRRRCVDCSKCDVISLWYRRKNVLFTALVKTMTADFCPNKNICGCKKDTIVDRYIDLLVTLFSNYNHCPFSHAKRQNYVNVKTDHNITLLNHDSSCQVRFSPRIVTKQNIRNSVVSVECMNRVQ